MRKRHAFHLKQYRDWTVMVALMNWRISGFLFTCVRCLVMWPFGEFTFYLSKVAKKNQLLYHLQPCVSLIGWDLRQLSECACVVCMWAVCCGSHDLNRLVDDISHHKCIVSGFLSKKFTTNNKSLWISITHFKKFHSVNIGFIGEKGKY